MGCSAPTTGPDAPASAQTAVVVITPSSSTVTLGRTFPLRAQAQDPAGHVVPNATVFWSSSDISIATVSDVGVVTAKALGQAEISANVGGKFAIATITVTAVRVASVTVLPAKGTVATGATLQFQAVPYDSTGNVLQNRTIIWASGAQHVATVDQHGVVTGVTAGTATISATSDGISGVATVTVQAPPPPVDTTPSPPPPSQAAVAHIVIRPDQVTMYHNQSVALTARLYDKDWNELSGRTITWTSSNTSIATVTPTGASTATVTAKKKTGTTTITATSEGKQDAITVTVAWSAGS